MACLKILMILEKCETYLKEVDKKSVIFTDFGNFLHFILSFNELSDLVVSHKVALYYTVPLRFLPMGHFGVLFLSLFSRISMFFRPNLTTKSNVPVQLLFFSSSSILCFIDENTKCKMWWSEWDLCKVYTKSIHTKIVFRIKTNTILQNPAEFCWNWFEAHIFIVFEALQNVF